MEEKQSTLQLELRELGPDGKETRAVCYRIPTCVSCLSVQEWVGLERLLEIKFETIFQECVPLRRLFVPQTPDRAKADTDESIHYKLREVRYAPEVHYRYSRKP